MFDKSHRRDVPDLETGELGMMAYYNEEGKSKEIARAIEHTKY